LIEALVSLGILAVGMLAVMTMQTATLRANLNNQNLLMAQGVAELAVEWVRTSRMSKSDSDAAVKATVFPAVGADAVSGLDSAYQFSGLSSAASSFPSGFSPDFSRFLGYRARLVQDPNRAHLDRDFVVRIAVERNYRAVGATPSFLSRCVATVYWLQNGELVSFDVIFFVERQA
jgi:type II secretory pathway pseudopilin PulG